MVAKLGKTVGLKGYLKLHNLSDFPSQFKKGLTLFCADRSLIIKAYNASNHTILFEDYESVEKARKLVNLELHQSIEETRRICKLKKDEYFYFDILGCRIKTCEQILGVVRGIVESGSSYIFEIDTDEILKDKGLSEIFFVPYGDKFVKSIDIEKREILCSNDAYLILENS